MAEFHWRSGVDGGTLTPLESLAGHGCASCGLLIPKTWEYCRRCGEEQWAIARQGPAPLAWWYGTPEGQPNDRRPLKGLRARSSTARDCTCEGEFIWACGPECDCYHHLAALPPMPELELRAAWGDR